jgi:hypothetical protein
MGRNADVAARASTATARGAKDSQRAVFQPKAVRSSPERNGPNVIVPPREVAEGLHARLFLWPVAFQHQGRRAQEAEVASQAEQNLGRRETHNIHAGQPDRR